MPSTLAIRNRQDRKGSGEQHLAASRARTPATQSAMKRSCDSDAVPSHPSSNKRHKASSQQQASSESTQTQSRGHGATIPCSLVDSVLETIDNPAAPFPTPMNSLNDFGQTLDYDFDFAVPDCELFGEPSQMNSSCISESGNPLQSQTGLLHHHPDKQGNMQDDFTFEDVDDILWGVVPRSSDTLGFANANEERLASVDFDIVASPEAGTAMQSQSLTKEQKTRQLISGNSSDKQAARGINLESIPSDPIKDYWGAKPILGVEDLPPHKTFFDISEMLMAKEELFRNQPEIVFTLFARVMRSTRENYQHKQYFRCQDLMPNSYPCMSGTLLG
ncbi:hypothetical protein S7711_10685 [Stachybotrys chartarum IBT 7711]|uniref:Uncharacterized protein n=1 Tax=Stachybotrys chartarum (strain CBS 109288 / IBT 7711) TaxID=1280523 RepID=A0A084AZL5_STACB|nr:hypothetical protein S7711_10685 [Stachybotrys chartarum IBT 7711]